MSMSARAQEEGRRYSGVCWWSEDEEYKSAAVGALGSQSGNTTLCSLCPPLHKRGANWRDNNKLSLHVVRSMFQRCKTGALILMRISLER